MKKFYDNFIILLRQDNPECEMITSLRWMEKQHRVRKKTQK